MKQIGSTPHEKLNYGKKIRKHLIIIKVSDSIKLVLEARRPSANNDISTEI